MQPTPVVSFRCCEPKDRSFVLNGRLSILEIEGDNGYNESQTEKESVDNALDEDLAQKQVMKIYLCIFLLKKKQLTQ